MGEVIVVTGASAGLGRAVVQRFARDGSAIGLIARGRERLESARAEVESLGARAIVLPLDRGIIIQVGSALAHRSIPLQSAYCASKHAIMGFHESLLRDAVHHAVRHDVGREFLVSWSTLKAVYGEKLVPAYIDRRLGEDGSQGEQTNESAGADRLDNLWEPAPGDFAAHGRFDDRSKDASVELWIAKRKSWLLLGGAMMLGAAVAARRRKAQ